VKKIITRVFFFAYPVLAIGFYFVFIHGQQARIATLEKSIGQLRKTGMAREATRRAEEIGQKQWDQIARIISTFAEKSWDFDKLDVPVFLGKLVRTAQVEVLDMAAGKEFEASGFGFFAAKIKIRGGFSQLLSLLRNLEENGKRFVFVDQLIILPTGETATYELNATLNVLLRGPAADLVPERRGPAERPIASAASS